MADITKALVEAANATGGYLVPDILANKVYELITANSVLMPYLEQVTMTSDTLLLPRTTKGTTAYWVSETGAITASDMEFTQITLSAKKVAALVGVSTELLEDANPSVAQLVTEQMARDLALKIDDEMFNGTGGTFSGLLYTGSLSNSVSCGASTNGGAITWEKIVDAQTEVLKDNHRQPDVCFFNPRDVGTIRKLTDGNGRPILDETTYANPTLKTGVVPTLMGMRVVPTTTVPINLSYGTGAGNQGDGLVGVSKMMGVFANRRKLTLHKDYVIDNDYWKFQANIRVAFAVKYPDSYCVIQGIDA